MSGIIWSSIKAISSLSRSLRFFRASDLELVGRGGHAQGFDRRIEVAVLEAKMLKPRLLFRIGAVHPVHAPDATQLGWTGI